MSELHIKYVLANSKKNPALAASILDSNGLHFLANRIRSFSNENNSSFSGYASFKIPAIISKFNKNNPRILNILTRPLISKSL